MASLIERFGKHAAAGEILFREGDVGKEMFVLQTGAVRLTRRIRHEEQEIAVVRAGEFFGEMSILNDKPRVATATVVDDADMLVLDPRTFEAMIKANAEIAVRMIRKLAERLDRANELVETLSLRDANSRIVACLLHFAHAHDATEGEITLRITMQDLKSRTGLELADVEAALTRLGDAQLVTVAPGGVIVRDVAKLERFLDFLGMQETFSKTS